MSDTTDPMDERVSPAQAAAEMAEWNYDRADLVAWLREAADLLEALP